MRLPTKLNLDSTKTAKYVGSGGTGSYWKLNTKVGIKINLCDPDGMEAEAKLLERLNEVVPGLFPKSYGLIDVVRRGLPYRGLLMEHIEGHTIATWLNERHAEYCDEHGGIDVFEYGEFETEVVAQLNRLEAEGFEWNDCHNENILITKLGTVRFIDAEPKWFDRIRSYK